MTITFLQPDGVSIPAKAARQGSAALYGGGSGRALGGRSGFRVDTASNVLTVTSTTWTLGPCAAFIDPGASTTQGMYGWSTDANVTGSVTAADATYGRMDIVYIQVNDSSAGDGSGATTAPVLYLAGAPSATPSPPTLPARSFLVGTITVPKATTGSPTVALNPARFVAAGGVLPVLSAADRGNISSPYVGLEIQRLDLTQVSPSGVRERWNGSGWDHIGHSEWTFNAATVPSGSVWGTGTLTIDTANSTDTGFISCPGADQLTIRDAGTYAIDLVGLWGSGTTGRAFTQITDTGGTNVYSRSSAAVGENNLSTSLANFRCAANTTIKLSTYLTLASGTVTWAGRVRITRLM